MTPARSCHPGSKGAALPGRPRPPQRLAMLRWWARGLFLKEIRVCTEEETELIYFLAFMFVKKSLQICFDQLMQHCISPRLHRESSAKGRADSRGLIRPGLGTRPGQGPRRAGLMTVPLPQGPSGTGFLLAAVGTSPIWVLPERLDGHRLCRAKPFPKAISLWHWAQVLVPTNPAESLSDKALVAPRLPSIWASTFMIRWSLLAKTNP